MDITITTLFFYIFVEKIEKIQKGPGLSLAYVYILHIIMNTNCFFLQNNGWKY